MQGLILCTVEQYISAGARAGLVKGKQLDHDFFNSMVTGFEIDGQRIARAQTEILADLVKAVKELVVQVKRLNDIQEMKIKY